MIGIREEFIGNGVQLGSQLLGRNWGKCLKDQFHSTLINSVTNYNVLRDDFEYDASITACTQDFVAMVFKRLNVGFGNMG